MHAASRDALAAVRAQHDVGGAPDGLGAELFAVVTLLDSERTLRRTLADASTEPDARADLVTRLLADKVASPALSLLRSAVRQRWSSARDLVDSVELLGRQAYLGRAQDDGALDTVEDELFRLGRIVAANPGLERALGDRSAGPDDRQALMQSLLAGKVSAGTAALVDQVVRRLRQEPAEAFDALSTLAARQREQSVAHVRSAVALTAEQHDRLTAALSRTYGRTVTVHVEVDPELVGGLVVQVGDEVIDGSVSGRLDALRRQWAG